MTFDDVRTTGRLKFVKNGISQETGFVANGKANADELRVSAYPHHKLSLIKNGEEIVTIPAHLFSLMCDHIDDASLRDLNVAYVGMSYADGTRSAKDRLISHSTLQQVLADLSGDDPDSEALILMVEYEAPQAFITIDGRDKSLRLEDDRDAAADLRRSQERSRRSADQVD